MCWQWYRHKELERCRPTVWFWFARCSTARISLVERRHYYQCWSQHERLFSCGFSWTAVLHVRQSVHFLSALCQVHQLTTNALLWSADDRLSSRTCSMSMPVTLRSSLARTLAYPLCFNVFTALCRRTMSVCLSVRPSVTRWYSVETASHMLTLFSSLGSHVIQLAHSTPWGIINGPPSFKRHNLVNVRFIYISRFNSKTVQDTAVVTMEDK